MINDDELIAFLARLKDLGVKKVEFDDTGDINMVEFLPPQLPVVPQRVEQEAKAEIGLPPEFDQDEVAQEILKDLNKEADKAARAAEEQKLLYASS